MRYSEKPLNPDTIDELAALCSLDALDAEAQSQADQAFAEVEGFAQQVREYEATVAAIPYSVIPIPMSADLKNRLFERIAEDSSSSTSKLIQLLEYSIEALKQQSSQLAWVPMKGANGIEIATWQTDEDRRESASFVRKTERGVFPNHVHATGEKVLVLEGDVIIDGQIYGVGDRIDSMANTTHQPATENGCLVLCITSMDDQILA
ncbi:MAG: anti-sigma factor [Symploca sp. SIO1A3]|nr:anti-sigma factor [Symploca sp. SIO2C1]NER49961.1 anti-sigma factor [Symploca sp. SIO1A3]